jgi:beta-1,4-mannosyl-glycoprotein beta-1,4-N-acetylglucosaminyltransferase
LRELLDHVDLFLIIESNSTFTGRSKPFVFAQNRDRFAFAAHKIVHKQFSLPFLNQNDEQSYFEVERLHRDQMQKLLVDQNLNTGDRIIFADLDEIPAGHTIDLIKSCSSPPRIHLQLRNYLFSFEFHIDNQSWRAQIATWPAVYSHSRATDLMLADAGWHCSYCFRTLDDFRFKMLGFSHADRVHYNSLLSDESIQSRICQGKDPFDMIPEAHSFSDLFRKMNPVKSKSAVGLPSWLVQNAEKFRFLLPGGCKRT